MNSAAGLELFDSYEGDYKSILASIVGKLDGEAKEGRGEQRKAVLRRVEMEVEEAEEILAQMELEIQSLDRQTKSKMQVKLRGYKGELAKRKGDVKNMLSSVDRNDLLGAGAARRDGGDDLEGGGAGSFEQTQAQRQRLLAGTDKLSDGQRRLEDSHRVALETEEMGASILGNLHTQRDQIINTRDTLHRADGSIDRASNTLKKMIRRAAQQRLVTFSIIGVLILLILLVLWSKLR